jgi:hypothetical protein
VLPTLKKLSSNDDIKIVVPNSLQMGWCKSLPFFSLGSETVRDIIDCITTYPTLPSHRFENVMLKEVLEQNTPTTSGETTFFEVFVDDFVGVTNNTTTPHLTHVSQAMINGIHSVFPPSEVTSHSGRDPILDKKLDKGEGVWSYSKEMLGWNLDGEVYTIQLPPAKCQAVILQIRKMLKLHCTLLNKYQKIAVKLQHASLGIPCGRALFSPLQMAMCNNPKFITLMDDLQQIFLDWTFMIRFMKDHPTLVLQLVTNYPDYIGHSDTCGLGCWGHMDKWIKTPEATTVAIRVACRHQERTDI